MYQPIFDDNLDEGELSPLENFIPLNNLIKSGGVKADRARKIMNQFTSTSNSKASRNSSLDNDSTTQKFKRAKYYGARRYKT